MRFRHIIVCAVLVTPACRAEQDARRDSESARSSAEPGRSAPAAADTSENVANPPAQPAVVTSSAPAEVAIGGLGSCQPSQAFSGLVSRWVQLADADGSGSISRPEADSFTNFLLGGFFFRADTNNDNVVTPAEGRAARAELLQQYPGLDRLLEQARAASGETPFKTIATALDVEYGKPLSADEARKAAQSALGELFRLTDTNQDATITLAEARAATWAGARAVGQQVFRAVDANNDGRVALEEFQTLVSTSAQRAFDAADANGNRELSQDEAAVALGNVADRLGVSMPQR